MYRLVLRAAPQRAATYEFSRADRLRIEWPVLAPADRRVARILDRMGRPLPIDLPLAEDTSSGAAKLVTELTLAPFARGDYQIELTATAGNGSDRKVITILVR